MSGIDATQGLAALLRQRVSALREAGSNKAARVAATPSADPTSRAGKPDLMRVAAPRIQALAQDDPDRRHKALRIYLEAALLRDLGLDLIDDPAFAEMVDAVQAQMLADAALAPAAQRLVDVLLSGAKTGT